ncbi:MAG TPA: L-rhamnose isomerase [Kiritimatiellia bacterium]|nr:L-rhamnose isomerase [Kiritimatiellia bacterium]
MNNEVRPTFREALDRFAALGVDVERAIITALAVPISLHCWQADDVAGFEVKTGATDGGGIMATGNYPGRARNGDEARADLDEVMRLLPGTHRVNVHALYAETGGKAVDRDALAPEHFAGWRDWAKQRKIGLDFNPTYFAHPKAAGLTLSHPDAAIRGFWVRHGVASRKIAESLARDLGSPCVNNHWIPDGAKDSPADRWSPRARLVDSLDRILDPKHGVDATRCVDAVESKLFGLGSEDYVVGSMEFYTGYALSRGLVQCLDMGHYHPTEGIADKVSALLQFQKKLLIHTSRPMRWDSDHVVILNDDVRAVFSEIVRGGALDRVYVALDFFDASINRIAAYVIGARATRQALLAALLEPIGRWKQLEADGKLARKLAEMEAQKALPVGAVWDELCRRANVPEGAAWMNDVERYEQTVLVGRT